MLLDYVLNVCVLNLHGPELNEVNWFAGSSAVSCTDQLLEYICCFLLVCIKLSVLVCQ